MTRGVSVSGLAILGLSAVCIGLASVVIMSGSRLEDAVDPPSLETTSIDLTIGSQDGSLSARGMVPGDAVAATVTVANSGRQPMTYAMRRGRVSTGGAPLAAALVLTIRAVGSSCADFDGAILFDGPLDETEFGREGDDRPLAAATAEILCLRVALPFEASDSLQGAETTVALSFAATWQASVE